MSLFSRKSRLTESGLLYGFTDHHCHILPGVDDGIATKEESLSTIRYFESLGVQKIIFTPHEMNEGKVSNERKVEIYEDLCRSYTGKMKFGLAGEYMLDSGFMVRMEQGLRPLEGNRVLVEASLLALPNNFYDLLFNVSLAGYTPVIAHPERYLYLDKRGYEKCKTNGYQFQLNLLSLAGFYGAKIKENAAFLLEQEMYDLIGTDIHKLNIFKKNIDRIIVTSRQQEHLLNLIRY